MHKLIEHNMVTDERRDIKGYVRVEGDGWYIEVRPTEDGIMVRSAGSSAASSRLIVRPEVSNEVLISVPAEQHAQMMRDAQRQFETWKDDETSPLRRKSKG